ncbi:MAG: hypothetical protein KDD15_26485 [Lewinella sp.]|nr:hypothetical protein [Lewinella sp.]
MNEGSGRQMWPKYLIGLLWLGTLVYTLAFALNFKTRGLSGIIWSDAEGYYMYLPAVFIYDGFADYPIRTNTGQFRPYEQTNKIFDKYTCAVAVLEMPFFLAAHTIASISEKYPADGYSEPYSYGMIFAGIFYGFVGLILLRRNLSVHFSASTADIVAMSIWLGTNLLHYATRAPGMAHVYSFFLFNLFIWLTHRYYRKGGNWKETLLLALTLGWIVLMRPTNIIMALYFLAYTPAGSFDLLERYHFFKKRIGHLLLFPLLGFLAFVPQMIYWHYMTGSHIFYSYRNEGFWYWKEPKLFPVLFSIKNGWLLFSPLMGIAITGLLVGVFRRVANLRLIFVIWLLAWYAFSSWSSWYFGGAFGHRAFIEFYALLAFPLAWVVQWILERKATLPKILFFTIWILLVYYSLGLADHYIGPHYEWKTWNRAMEAMFTW